jgi:lipopolysaccharide/colanic/teichoic acid biosynthesis glycosyltransferase
MRDISGYVFWKGLAERFIALMLIIILSPVLGLIALAVALDSPGNPVFSQTRIGQNGRKFTLYKFRSMYRDQDDTKFKAFIQRFITENTDSWLDEKGNDVYELVRDPRITRLGLILRRSSLDELPQLLNILKGEMAFIGPRPDLPFAVDLYQDHHKQRLLAKPGITGLWQVSGRRSLAFDDQVKLDVDYINRQSLFTDIKITLLTIREMFSPDKAERKRGKTSTRHHIIANTRR